MASTPNLRNGNMPLRATSTPPTNQNAHLADHGTTSEPQVPKKVASLPRVTIGELRDRFKYVRREESETYVTEDPVFNTIGASILLGPSVETLRKWRQRGKGPGYYQYGVDGPVYYPLSALNAYKAAHLVTPRKKGRR